MSRPTGDWARAIIYGMGDQKEWSNDFWFSISAGSPTSSWDPVAAATAIFNKLTTHWVDVMSDTYSFRGINFVYNFGAGSRGVDYYNALVGNDTNEPMPEDCNVVVTKNTANLRKGGQGRWLVTPPSQDHCTGSYLNGDGITAWTTVAVDFKTAVMDQGITWSPAHWSPKLSLLIPVTNTPIVALLGTDRRRRFRF